MLSMIGSIAARDFPDKWPSLLADTLKYVQVNDPKVRVKGLRLIHYILKAMIGVGK